MEKTNLKIESLLSYSNHIFTLYEGKRMDDMVKSIKSNGVFEPIIVRQIGDSKYEILAGHNRVAASKLAGLDEIEAIIKENLTDDEATLIVIESNLFQRSFADLKHSERALVLLNHHESVKKMIGQGRRSDLFDFLEDETCGQIGHKLKSRDKVASHYKLSSRTVSRYIQIARLSRNMLKKLDEKAFGLTVAIELSCLPETVLNTLNEIIDADGVKISLNQAKLLHDESDKNEGMLNRDAIFEILNTTTSKKQFQNINLSKDIAERLADHNVQNEATIGRIVSAYLNMLERGEAKNVIDEQ